MCLCVYVCIRALARVHASAIFHVGVKSRACVGGRSLARMYGREKAREGSSSLVAQEIYPDTSAPFPPPSRAIRLSLHRPVIIASQWRRPLIMFHNTSYPHSNIHSLKGSSSFIYIIFIPEDNAASPDLCPLLLSLSPSSLLSPCSPTFSSVLSVLSTAPRPGQKAANFVAK